MEVIVENEGKLRKREARLLPLSHRYYRGRGSKFIKTISGVIASNYVTTISMVIETQNYERMFI